MPDAAVVDATDPKAVALRLKELANCEHADVEAAGTGTTDGGAIPAVFGLVPPSGMTPPPSVVTTEDVTAAEPGADVRPVDASTPPGGVTQPGSCVGSTAAPVVPMTSSAELVTSGSVPKIIWYVVSAGQTVLAPMGSP